jgi:hypothetical protein
MDRKSSVMPAEMPPRDQPVAAEMGCKNTARENMAPTPTHVMSAPAATMTQRY